MKRKILAILGILSISLGLAMAPEPTYAAGGNGCGGAFLGFKPWYNGLKCDADNGIQIDKVDEDGGELKVAIWTIVLNIIFDLSLAVGYLALAMVIYGGYMYIISSGDVGKSAKAQKTLTTAVIGTVIAAGATVIVNTLTNILGLGDINSAGESALNGGSFGVDNILSWAYLMAGVVAVVFIVKSGFEYIISQGDPSKLQKAKRGLIMSVVGLIIVILASIITNVILGVIGDATTGQVMTTVVAEMVRGVIG